MVIRKRLLCALLVLAVACSTVSAKSKKKSKNGLQTSATEVNADKEKTDDEIVGRKSDRSFAWK